MAPPNGERCETCRYWLGENDSGECRRHSPTMTHEYQRGDDRITMARWPPTESRDWCGEWARHDPPDMRT